MSGRKNDQGGTPQEKARNGSQPVEHGPWLLRHARPLMVWLDHEANQAQIGIGHENKQA